ncbi:LysR substrate-binding domain-containing protein [Klebsiella pneumoniae]|nr:LysR substrate-binding domain-containing protein [Klebsiella pneumoniae]
MRSSSRRRTGITCAMQNLDEQTLNALESGKCDLAIGYLTQLPESVYQQHLFDQSYVCLAAENHPRIRAQLRAEDWRQERSIWRSAWRGLPAAIWISNLMSTTCPGALLADVTKFFRYR